MSNGQKVIRKLRAILSADVKGYSLLMADDEAHTIQTLKAYRGLMSNLIQNHSGSVIDNPGDNLLAEFSSAVDAVEAAVQIQNRLRKENAKFVEDKRLQFRIGVNIGDVVHDDGRIYGSGVNIAARIEAIADRGGICISRNTYNQVQDKLDLGFEYLGEHEVKNIKGPVRVYKVLMDTEAPKPLVEEQFELPDKPSIAVLPFTNMSGDPSQEYFSDGLTEQIINGLCKVSNLFVIARNSSFAYKGKAVNVQQVGKELGVRYVLEGSVQKAIDHVRITAQLIDAATGFHLWSENYDRDLSDVFALQDEITLKLIDVMQIKLTFGEQARLWEGGTTSIRALDRLMRGNDYFFHNNEKDNKQAQRFYQEATNIDKDYTMAHALLGFTYIFELLYEWSKSPLKSFEQAENCAQIALCLNDSLDMAHLLSGWIYLFKRQHDKAIEEGELAIELNPNGAEAHAHLGLIQTWSDNVELGVNLLKRAFRLNPNPPTHYYQILAMAYNQIGQYKKAIELLEKGLSSDPDHLSSHLMLVHSYSSLNRIEEAHKAVDEVLRINPNFSLDYLGKMIPNKNQANIDRMIGELHKAGLPD
jgi:adenylate cyclase